MWLWCGDDQNSYTGLPKSQIQVISEAEAKEGDVIGGKVVRQQQEESNRETDRTGGMGT